MKRYILSIPLLACCAGCSSLPSLFATNDDAPDSAMTAAMAPTVPQAQYPVKQFCARVAANAQAKAGADGFDAATQDRMRQQSYRQCAPQPD